MNYKEDMIYHIKMDQIYIDPRFNIRSIITPESCYELASDIKERGLLYPVILRERDESEPESDTKPFALIAGFRRFEACKIIESKRIKAVFFDVDEKKALEINLSENINRENLSLKDEVEIISTLFKKGLKPKEIKRIVKKNLGWITNRICIGRLPHDIKNKVYSGHISIADAIDLGREYDPFLREISSEHLLDLEINKTRKKLRTGQKSIRTRRGKTFRSKKEIDVMTKYLMDKLGDDLTLFKVISWARYLISYKEIKEYLIEKYPYLDWNEFPEREIK